VDEAATRLGYCSVDAPVAGTVLTVNVSAGQLVSSTVPVTLLTMVDDSKRRVRAYIDEREIAKVCPGQHARVTADGAQIDGVVETIGVITGDNPLANNPSRQFREVMLSLPKNAQQTPIGLRVSIQFALCTAAQKAAGK